MEKNRNIEGTGLGLAITHNLAEMMGGRIEAESVYGKGSAFTLFLSQMVIAAEFIGNFPKRYRDSTEDTQKYAQLFMAPDASVLVVDDNKMNLMQQQCFDVIFLDHMMPGLDGIETLKRSKQLENNLSCNASIIALTANAISGVKEMYLNEGFDDYLSKPIDGNELVKCLNRYLPVEKVKQEMTQKSQVTEMEIQVQQEIENEQEPLIDRALGIQYCAGSEELYLQILQMYCDMYSTNVNDLQKFYDTDMWNDYTISIHALKSNSLNIGAKKLSEQCLQLELAGKRIRAGEEVENSMAYIRENHFPTMELYKEVIDTVENDLK